MEVCWTLVGSDDSGDQPSVNELKTALEKGSEQVKIETMKKILGIMINGDPLPQLIMHVIRFVLPSKNKQLKKLLLFYWEICPKKNSDGKLKQEMILVCNYIRNDLQSPNEYVRGVTMRLLCKLREPELLEPLIPSCRQGLEHRHPFVRRNAVFAIYTIHKHFESLIPDGPELIYNYMLNEADMAAKRNAFIMLCNADTNRALQFLTGAFPLISSFDEFLQLAIIELIKKDCHINLAAKGKYINCIVNLLGSPSPAVKYEAANALIGLTSSPMAIREIAVSYIDLAVKEPDNNVKLIVLESLNDLRKKHERLLTDLVMDVLRVLNSPDIEVCRKAIQIVLEMAATRNIEEVTNFLKKEISKTHDPAGEKNVEYRQLLIHAIHQCAIKFPEVAANVVHVLMEFLGDPNNTTAVDVVTFVREVVECNGKLRKQILDKLLLGFPDMKSGKVLRGALWIVGEYCTELESIEYAFREIRGSIGELPIVASEQREFEESKEKAEEPAPVIPQKPVADKTVRRVLADGTYATESAFVSSGVASPKTSGPKSKPPLRMLIMNGDYFLGAVLATALTKLALHAQTIADPVKANQIRAEAMLIMTSIIRVGQSKFVNIPIDEDSYSRILTCIRVLSTGDEVMKTVFSELCRDIYSNMVREHQKKEAEKEAENNKSSQESVDSLISFRQLQPKGASGDSNENYEMDIMRAAGQTADGNESTNRLNRIIQLTGFSDPVYAEAFVDVHQYDILLDVLVVNQTMETLQNLTLEFATLGDLKLVERPSPRTMGPHSFQSIKANIKVSSTETGVIFGNIVYDGPGVGDSHVIALNDIHIDIMDYINPAICTENQFRAMWTEFEWENKVNVNTNIKDIRKYLQHILKSTNMTCLTPEPALAGECGFLAANMYAKSIFGEDALANICLEQRGNSPISGHIRIRSKTQGIALSLGDKISLSQKVKV